jgi:hypothetical protein
MIAKKAFSDFLTFVSDDGGFGKYKSDFRIFIGENFSFSLIFKHLFVAPLKSFERFQEMTEHILNPPNGIGNSNTRDIISKRSEQ